MSRNQIPEYTNSQMRELIDEHIHNAKHRDILKMRYLDGQTYEQIAERTDMSFQQIRTIIYKAQNKLLKYL